MKQTAPATLISELQASSSRLKKEEIIRKAISEDNDEFFLGMIFALDPLCTFGVGDASVPIRSKDPLGSGLPWEDFYKLALRLMDRELTGNAAKEEIFFAMQKATPDQWNFWYRRILLKNPDCGVSEKTINKLVSKTHPKWIIPVFSCQLATDSAQDPDRYLHGKKQIEVKLDGVRVLTVVKYDGSVQMFSRNGRELTNFPLVFAEFEEVVKKDSAFRGKVFDGEIMSSSFQDLMKQVHRKSNVKTDDAILYLFDFVDLVEFQEDSNNMLQWIRSDILKEMISRHAEVFRHVQTLEWQTLDLDDVEDQKKFVDLNRTAIENGYEGIMLKDPNARYECKRTKNWLKLKPFIECTLTVVGLEEGTGKNSGMTGAFICEGVSDCGKPIRVNVGSGLSDQLRKDSWINDTEVVGSLVEIRADTITKNQNSDVYYSLRFPRFKTFRTLNGNEKL